MTVATASALWEPRLLERERELSELQAAMRAARGGAGCALVVEGPAGLGKTRLLRGLRSRATRAGMHVLVARGTELEREFPYGVVRQLLEPVLARCVAREREALLEGPAAAARPVLGLGSSADAPEKELSFATLYGLHWVVANLAQSAPLLVEVDDAHWADISSIRFLRFLATRIEGLPVLLAVGSRPVDAADPLAALASDPAIAVVRPEPLRAEACAELIGAALGSPPDPRFASACHDLTGGNPFLVSELARKLAADAVPPVSASVPAVEGLVPGTILRSVLQRLASAGEDACELARAVAVLGDGCEQQHAAALAHLAADSGAEAADSLRAVQILDPEPPLRFVHPLVRNAVYADMPAGARSREHERAAALLAEHGLPAERIAGHLLAMDPQDNGRVVEILHEAARGALAKGAPDPAIAYLHRALNEPAPAPVRPRLLELLNTAALRATHIAALAPFEDEAFAALTADRAAFLRSAEGLAKYLIASGRPEEGVRMLRRAAAAAEEAGDLRLALEFEAQVVTFARVSPAESRARFERYRHRVAPGTQEERLLLGLRAWRTHFAGHSAAATAAVAKRALEPGPGIEGLPDPGWWGQTILALAGADELDVAARAADVHIERATARGAVASMMTGWFMRGTVALRRGDIQRAEADAVQLAEFDVRRYSGFFAMVNHLFASLFVDVMVERDRLDAAEREVARRGLDGALPDMQWIWPVLFSRGRLRLAQGRARESLDDMLELRRQVAAWGRPAMPGLPLGAVAARALIALRDPEQARTLAEEQLAAARRWGAASGIAEALAALGVAVGGEAGLDLLREAVDVVEAAPTRLLHASILTDLGALLRRERRPADAREPLRAALDIARRCGATAAARRAAHELEATGEKVQRYTPIGLDALTASERRVAEMAARGMTNREIAAALYVTVKTVESHLRATYDKVGVRSRQELREELEPSATWKALPTALPRPSQKV